MASMGLRTEGASFGYHASEPVLKDVRVCIERGSLVGILGPNGSGKTTLLRVLAGLVAPWTGTVTLDDADLCVLGRAAAARRIAVVPQETQLAFEYTALEMAVMGRFRIFIGLKSKAPRILRSPVTPSAPL